jgi:hypothetical protein
VTLPQAWTFWADVGVPPYTPLGMVRAVNFSCNWVLSGFGQGQAEIPIAEGGLSRDLLLQFWGYRLWAFYGGNPIWAGMPTGLVDAGGDSVAVSLAELPGYLGVKQYATNQVYTNVEQTTIAADLAARLDNIGVPRVIVPGSGVLRSRTFTYLMGQSRAQLLADFCNVTNAPEFRSEYAMSGGRPQCSFKIAFPRCGGASGLGLVMPGGVVSAQATWGSDKFRTRTFSVGDLGPNAATTANRPVEVRVLPQAGVPEVDCVDDHPGDTQRATISDLADTYASIYASPVLELTAVMPASAPAVGTYNVGDDVAISLADPLMPTGMTGTGRLISAALDAGAGTVTWTVAVTVPPPRKSQTLLARLHRLDMGASGRLHTSLDPPPGGINP